MNRSLLILVPFFAIGLVALAVYTPSHVDSRKSISKPKYDYRYAWDVVKDHVRSQLKAPADAEFPWFEKDVNIVDVKDNSCGVIGYVDAKNSFGVRLRYKFAAICYNRNGAWYITEFNLFQ